MAARRLPTIRRDLPHAYPPGGSAIMAARAARATPNSAPASVDHAPAQPLTRSGSGPRMRVLSVLSSSNQMYSGIGRTVFELTARLRGRVDFEFAIDDRFAQNVDLVVAFGQTHSIPVHVGPATTSPHSLDTGNADLPGLLRQDRWDLIEALCWANSATNEVVLDEVGDRALVYTAHYQPSWTVPMEPATAAQTEAIHLQMTRRADAVLCVSPAERTLLQGQAWGRNNCVYLANGCNLARFQPQDGPRRPELLFVGDLLEPRKRFDRVLALLPGLLRLWPDLKLVVVGNRNDAVIGRIPAQLRSACELRGPISDAELCQAYGASRGVFLLSEFEAFGYPILEGLASGTPVFLTDLPVARSLFGTFTGAKFCPGDDPEATLAVVVATLQRGELEHRQILRERDRLADAFDWDVLALKKWEAMAAAWFTRHHIDRPFRGPRPHTSTGTAPRSEPTAPPWIEQRGGEGRRAGPTTAGPTNPWR